MRVVTQTKVDDFRHRMTVYMNYLGFRTWGITDDQIRLWIMRGRSMSRAAESWIDGWKMIR